jgi:hypothetical protein
MITSLQIGQTIAMVQNQVYASPVNNLCRFTCDDTTATFQVANDVAFTNTSAATLSGSGYDNGYGFIRVTNKNATINVRIWSA